MMTSPTASTFKVMVHSVSHEVPDLTAEEKLQLEAVIQKAKEFEEEEQRKPIEGQLYKYTNVMRGWQFRWFVLTPVTGMLEYYMMEEPRKNRPKGGLHLSGAVILTNEEDNNSFTVNNTMTGEMYKLKALDAKERQFWISRLQSTIDHHTTLPIEVPTMSSHLQRTQSQSSREMSSVEQSPKSIRSSSNGPVDDQLKNVDQDIRDSQSSGAKNSLASIRLYVNKALSSQRDIAKTIEQLPIDGMHLRCSDSTLLLLKATSQATVQSLECCYLILKQNEHSKNHPKGLPPGATIQWIDTKKDTSNN